MAVENFVWRGKPSKRVTAEPYDRFLLGLDLGQSQDYSAICVMHHTRRPLDSWTIKKGMNVDVTRQDVEERYLVRHLERLPLGTPYPQVIRHISDMLARPPLSNGCDFILDQTGVGAPCGDLFVEAGLSPIRVSITAGSEVNRVNQNRWNVAKVILISALDAKLHCGELRIAPELAESETLRAELADFRRNITEAGRATYQARTGANDDLVLAVAMPCWWADERRKYQIHVGYYPCY